MEDFIKKCLDIIDTPDNSDTEHEAKRLLGQCLERLEICIKCLSDISENKDNRDAYTLSCSAMLVLFEIG